jgi:hypothetical protein
MNRKDRRAAQRASNKAAKSNPRSLRSAGFFYSPTDSVDNVLSIQVGGPMASLPAEMLPIIMNAEYLRKQDIEAAKDPSMFRDYFAQLDEALAHVNFHIRTNSQAVMSHEFMSHLCIMAANIYWLTTRGHLKQSEYNGTLFVS